ncbi:organomercurial lyase [Streptococcus hongkongensis]
MLNKSQDAINQTQNISLPLSGIEKIKRYAIIEQILYHRDNRSFQYEKDLAVKNILHYSSEGQLDAAYPFSLKPTNKTIQIASLPGNTYHAMCAIDALGIYYLLNDSIRIVSDCPMSQETISITMDIKTNTIQTNLPDIRILHVDLSQSTNWATDCCTQMHFFSNQDNLVNWLKANACSNQTYYSLTLDEACRLAEKLFGFY